MLYSKRSKTTFSLTTFIFLSFFFVSFSFVSAAPTVKVEPVNQTITNNQKATVKITTTQATKCTVTGDTYNKNVVQLNGNILLSPTKSVAYVFECTDINNVVVRATSTVSVPSGTPTTTTQPTTQTPTPANNGTVGGQRTGTAPQIQYPSQTTQTEAANICEQYSGFKSVYEAASAGGGASVPTDLTQLRPVLEAINKNTQLTANEMRAADMIRFCKIIPNIAAASAKLAQEASKQLKTIADNCYADERCLLKRKYDSDLQRELERLQKSPMYGREISQMLIEMNQKDPYKEEDNFDFKQIQKCNALWKQGRNPDECVSFMTANEDVIKTKYYAAARRIETAQSSLAAEFQQGNGVIGSHTCTKTNSGSDPTQVKWYDKDCQTYNKQPLLINQEILKQIAALPYTQAYSPAAELGVDQAINNINTRVQSGNLVDPDISTGFGSISGGGSNPVSGGGSITNATDMKTVEPNYKKLLSNIETITTLYDVTREAYASSTSVCKNIPVRARSQTLEKVAAARKSFADYATALTAQWNNALKTPKENHINLVTRINFDLKDKYNQLLINQVHDSVKKLLQACVDASASTTAV